MGDDNEASVSQSGTSNVATVTQDDDNVATVAQGGDNNVATVTQQTGNTANVDQGGDNNTATVNQKFAFNAPSIGNTATIVQSGDYNEATTNQDDNNTATVTQLGIGTAVDPNTVLISQYNNGDVATATQLGGSGNSIVISQEECCTGNTGVDNYATAIQDGSNNSTTITQLPGVVGPPLP